MSIYNELKPVAAELLKEFKQGVIQYVQITAASGAADEPGTPTETKTTVDAVEKGVSFKYLQNNFATASDKIITMPPIANVVPSLNDFIDINSERYKIVADISPVGSTTRIVWKFIVRKGG